MQTHSRRFSCTCIKKKTKNSQRVSFRSRSNHSVSKKRLDSLVGLGVPAVADGVVLLADTRSADVMVFGDVTTSVTSLLALPPPQAIKFRLCESSKLRRPFFRLLRTANFSRFSICHHKSFEKSIDIFDRVFLRQSSMRSAINGKHLNLFQLLRISKNYFRTIFIAQFIS